jgi:hypothetical protein
MSHISECNCLWCILIDMNFQCCDVLIRVYHKSKKSKDITDVSVRMPIDYRGETPELIELLAHLGKDIFENKPQLNKSGVRGGFTSNSYRGQVSCIEKTNTYTLYSLCFHTINTVTPENDPENPV